ncbi:MAG: FadR family transcriptional regulator [Clostridiales bacterium]|nr:FadR family transcriptional regulator [Clostridiales bacterium]
MNKTDSEKYTLQRAGVSEQIFEILKKKIASGEWKAGEKIYSENEIAAQFGVSRMSARNAVQRLCAMGLLETRPGEGTFVKELKLSNYFKEALELFDLNQSMSDISEFRRFFERAYLVLACERRTDEDIQDLKKLHNQLCQLSVGEDFDLFFETDMAFHHRICEMARNGVFLMVEMMLHDSLMTQLKDNTKLYSEVKDASFDKDSDHYILKILANEHADFIEALEKREPALATDHLDYYISSYNEMRKKD